MTTPLAFRLKLPGMDRFVGLNAVSTSLRVHGLLGLEGDVVTIQWSGVARVQEVGPLTLRDDRETLPEERITLPVSRLSRATLIGGWLRPRLALEAREFRALAEVPSEEHGTVQLWYARKDRKLAASMAGALNAAIRAGALE